MRQQGLVGEDDPAGVELLLLLLPLDPDEPPDGLDGVHDGDVGSGTYL